LNKEDIIQIVYIDNKTYRKPNWWRVHYRTIKRIHLWTRCFRRAYI